MLTLVYYYIETTDCIEDVELIRQQISDNTPYLPQLLFDMVAKLMERSTKGFPVKKLLLSLWKTILVSLGGLSNAKQRRTETRHRLGLNNDRT